MRITRASLLATLAVLSACADSERQPTAVAPAPAGPSSVIVPGSGTYMQLASMPTARMLPAGAALRGRLYVSGGFDQTSSYSSKVERYNPLDNSWVPVGPLPIGLASHAMVASGDRLFVLGGSSASAYGTNTLLVSDRLVTGWTSIGPMPRTRGSHAAVAVDGKIYVMGGQDAFYGVRPELDIYDTETATWSEGAPIPYSAAAPAGIGFAIGRTIHFLSYVGWYGIYDIDEDEWSVRPTGAMGLFGTTGGVVDGRLYQLIRSAPTTQALGYDPATLNETASLLTPPSESNFHESANATIGNTIYAAGGTLSPSGAKTNALWSFKPAFADNHSPTLTINGPYRASEGATIAFSSAASDPDGDALSYLWDFGDGATSTSASTTHPYEDDGDYTVTLTVNDGNGGSRSRTSRATIRNAKPTVTGIARATLSQGGTYSATGTITDPGLSDTFTATVDWGEGSGPASHPVTGNSISLSHAYETPGYYNLVVKITDDDGAVVTVSRWIRVKPGD